MAAMRCKMCDFAVPIYMRPGARPDLGKWSYVNHFVHITGTT